MRRIVRLLLYSDIAWLVFQLLLIVTIQLAIASLLGQMTMLVWIWNFSFIGFCFYLVTHSDDSDS